jgi:hypothetical protein
MKRRSDASRPFQPNGLTTKSGSTPRRLVVSTAPAGVTEIVPNETPLAVSSWLTFVPDAAARDFASATWACSSVVISMPICWRTPRPSR